MIERESPFRGIHPFGYKDRVYFCGREALIKELESNVLLHRLVVFFGKSGAGKSSAINAGLVPSLLNEGVRCERLRLGSSTEYPLVLERILSDDNFFLPSFFDEACGIDPTQCEEAVPLSLETFLSSLGKISESPESSPGPKVALIFDQFEELFTRIEVKDGVAGPARQWQKQLTDAIVKLATQGSSKIRLLLVIREDFLADLEVMERDFPRVLDYRVRLNYLTGSEATSAVLGPFERHVFPTVIDADLARMIVYDIAKAELGISPSSDSPSSELPASHVSFDESRLSAAQLHSESIIPPTQIQIVCRELWNLFSSKTKSIGLAEYRSSGRVEGILKGFFQSELSEVSPVLHRAVIVILKNLVTDSQTRDVVSKRRLRDLALDDGLNVSEFDSALEQLILRRLVDVRSQRGTHFYEVASEYLIPSILKEAQAQEVDWEAEKAAAQSAREAAEREREAAREREIIQLQKLAKEQEEKATTQQKLAKEQEERATTQQKLAERTRELLSEQQKRSDEQAVWARKMRLGILCLGVLFMVSVVLLALYIRQSTNRATSLRLSNARLFATESKDVLPSDNTLALKLALKAAYATWQFDRKVSPEAQSSLNLATVFTLSIPCDESRTSEIILSRDWKHIASVSSTGAIRVQDVIYEEPAGEPETEASEGGDEVIALGTFYEQQTNVAKAEGKLSGTGHHLTDQAMGPCQIFDVSHTAPRSQQGGEVRPVDLWEATSVKQSVSLQGTHVSFSVSPAFSQDGSYVAFTSLEHQNEVFVWKIDSGGRCILSTPSKRKSEISALAFSSGQDDLLAAGDVDGTTTIWNARSCSKLQEFSDHTGPVLAIEFSPHSKYVVTAGADQTARIREVGTEKETILTGHKGSIVDVTFSPDGKLLATSGLDRKTKIWDGLTGRLMEDISIQPGFPMAAFSGDGHRLVVVAGETADVFDVNHWMTPISEIASKDPISGIAMNKDGSEFATVGNDSINIYTIDWEKQKTLVEKHGVKSLSSKECNDLVPDGQCNDFLEDKGFLKQRHK